MICTNMVCPPRSVPPPRVFRARTVDAPRITRGLWSRRPIGVPASHRPWGLGWRPRRLWSQGSEGVPDDHRPRGSAQAQGDLVGEEAALDGEDRASGVRGVRLDEALEGLVVEGGGRDAVARAE